MIGPGLLLLITILVSLAAAGAGLIVFLFLRRYGDTARAEASRCREYSASLENFLGTSRSIQKIFTCGGALDQTLQDVCKTLVNGRNYYSCWIFLLDEDRPTLPLYHYGISEGILQLEADLKKNRLPLCVVEAAADSGVFVTQDPEAHCTNCPLNSTYGEKAGFTVEISHGNTTLGYMCVSVPREIVNSRWEQDHLIHLAEDIGHTVWSVRTTADRRRPQAEISAPLSRISDGVLSLDSINRILSFDRGAEDLFENKAENVVGKSILQFQPVEERVKWQSFFSKLNEKGFVENENLTAVLPKGRIKNLEVTAYKAETNGKTKTTVFIKAVPEAENPENGKEKKQAIRPQKEFSPENLKLTDLFKLEELQQLQDDFAEATGVASIITDMKGNHITSQINFCPFCEEIVRDTDEGLKACLDSEEELGAYNPAGPNFRKCSVGGLYDAGAGIMVDGRQIGKWYIGQIICESEFEEDEEIKRYAVKIGKDPEEALKAYHHVPVISKAAFERAAVFLHTLANQLSRSAAQNLQQIEGLARRQNGLEQLQKSEEYMESIFRAAPIGIGVVKERVFTNVNRFLCEMTGYSEEELLGKKSIMIYPDQETFETVGRDKYTQIAEKGSGSVETRFQKKDGSIINVLLSSTPIDLEDHSFGVTFSAMDITQRKKDEEERRKLTLGIEQSREAYIITDAEGLIEYINPAFTNITGYPPSELLGQNPRILKSGEHDQEFYQNLWNTISIKQTWRGRMVNRKKDGSLYTEENTISPVLDENGEIINFIAIKRDISSILEIEKEKKNLSEQYRQAQKVESIGRLAGGIAHDLNNLLSPILGYSELLEETIPENSPEHYQARQILQAGIRAKDLVHQLLAFSRKQSLLFERSSLNTILEKFNPLLRSSIREDIEIKLITKKDIPEIMADRGQIEQVVMNLSINSQDAMPAGGKLIIETDTSDLDGDYATYHPGAKPGHYAVLSVSDTGTGMSKEIQEQVFEPFFSTKGEDGTGLGLATVYGIIKQHSGNIWIYSEPGRGSTFKIYLPAAGSKSNLQKADPEYTLVEKGEERVLLAEDNDEVRHLCKTILESAGYIVNPAKDGRQAMELVNSGNFQFDLLLTDVIMPGMNGHELFLSANKVMPGMKVLYMSGYTDNVIDIHFKFSEGKSFLQKPFSNRELLSRIRTVLNLSK